MNGILRNSIPEIRLILHAATLYGTVLLVLDRCHRLEGGSLFMRLVDGTYISFPSLECIIVVSALHMAFAPRLAALGALKGMLAVAFVSGFSTLILFSAIRLIARL